MTQDALFGFAAALGSWLCFGTFAVPIKTPAVRSASIDPIIFQSYKTFWTFVTSWTVLLWQDFEFTWWGLASGICWVPAGVAAIIAVKHVGIAAGQMTWQVLIIIVSFAWGLVLGEQIASIAWTTIAVMLLLLGLVGMTFAFNLQVALPTVCGTLSISSSQVTPQSKQMHHMLLVNDSPSARQSSEDLRYPFADVETPESKSAGFENQSNVWRASPSIGFAAAVFNGLWGGSNLVPMHFAPVHGAAFAVSFASGALIVNLVLLLVYAGILLGQKKPFPKWHLKIMFWPGFFCGALWSAGNIFSIYAIETMGQSIGYSCVQASVIVSGCWGIFYYHELSHGASGIWLLSAAFAMGGVAILANQHVDS